MSRSSIAVIIVLLAQAVLGGSRPAWAQYFPQYATPAVNIEGLTVAGNGFVSAKPNRLEIDLEVSAASELTADAIVKYRDTKKRLEEAFTALKLENVAVEERGLLVDQKGAQFNPYFYDPQPSKKGKVEVQLTRKLIVNCKNIRKMDEDALLQLVGKLVDVAQDAGGKFGGHQNDYEMYYYGRWNRFNGLVRFILDDFDKLEEEAYEKAIADAAKRANRLAKLSHIKLGPVTAVREISVPSETPTEQQEDEAPKKRLQSSRFQEIPVRVNLLVRYDVAAPPAANGRTGQQ